METPSATTDQRRFRDTLGCFATGVTVITASEDAQVHGMTANGFMSVSLDPPLVVVSIASGARMHGILDRTGRYGVSVLSRDHEGLSRHFAGRPAEGLQVTFDEVEGVPLVHGTLARVAAKIIDAHQAGDHTLFVGEVLHFDRAEGQPLVFHSGAYWSLLDGRDPTVTETWPSFCVDPIGPSWPAGHWPSEAG